MSSLTATAHPDVAAADVVLDLNIVLDAYGRTVASGWGNADTGQAYTNSGGAASDYSVSSGTGRHSLGTVGTERTSTIDTGIVDHEITVDRTFGVATALTSPIRYNVAGRLTDISNFYFIQLELGTDGLVRATLQKRVAGSNSTITSAVTIGTTGASDWWRITLRVSGSDLYGYARNLTTGAAGELTGADTAASHTTGTRVGVTSILVTGNTNTSPVLAQFDNLSAGEITDLWTIERVYPDGSAQELLGSPTYTSGGYAVMWDTVLPLDVPIYYTATNDLTTTILTSNTITVTGSGQGWLKDPAEPINDLLLGACPDRVCPLDVDNDDTSVSFLRLGQGAFPTATGVYPIIDAARSRTVAQTRKARESTLAVLSHTLEAGARVEGILASGRNLFLQLAARYGWAYRNYASDYIAVGDATEDRPPLANMTWPHRAWGLPFFLARAPYVASERVGGNGIGVTGATYGDATATGRTYADRTATGNTYLDSSRGENL